MTLEKAIQKAEMKLGGKVISVFDCGDRWALGFDWQKENLTSFIWCCLKDTGKIVSFFPPDEPEVAKRAKRVPLPE